MQGAPGWTDFVAPGILFLMMLVVGLELTRADFRRVARQPGTIVLGTLGQWTLLPLLTAGIALALEPSPGLVAGMVLILAAPGGGISNVFTMLGRANTALSVTLTAVASLGAVVTLPLILSLGVGQLVGEAADFEVPVLPMVGQLVLFVLLPIGIGMSVRARHPAWALQKGPRLRSAAMILVFALIALGAFADTSELAQEALNGMGLGLLWTVSAMALGYAIARALRLDADAAFTFAIEYGVKNVGLAAIVAISALDRPDLAIFSGAYVATGYPLAALLCLGRRRLLQARQAAPAEDQPTSP